jgi:curli production assembly/transport component CsgF
MKTIHIFLFFILFSFSYSAIGQDLVYQPVNPNFGGYYLNYSWLLASAKAQNPFDDQDNNFGLNRSALSNFSESTKRQILNELTRNALNGSQIGDNGDSGSQNGTFEIGGLVIKIEETKNGSMINIIDTDTGESTQILL